MAKHLPRYRVLTGPDDAAFCEKVSDALAQGYALHGDPAITYGGGTLYVAQAVVWAGEGDPPEVEQGIEDGKPAAPYNLNSPRA